MPASKLPPPVRELDKLIEPFAARARQLIDAINAEGLPMVVEETLRTVERQRGLLAAGVSKLALGPHCYGLAMDMVLDPRDPRWVGLGGRPFRAIDGGGAAWDTGYDADARGIATLARQAPATVWKRYGELALDAGLEWGGLWMTGKYAGYPFGWDVAHVQLPAWDRMVRAKTLAPAS